MNNSALQLCFPGDHNDLKIGEGCEYSINQYISSWVLKKCKEISGIWYLCGCIIILVSFGGISLLGNIVHIERIKKKKRCFPLNLDSHLLSLLLLFLFVFLFLLLCKICLYSKSTLSNAQVISLLLQACNFCVH